MSDFSEGCVILGVILLIVFFQGEPDLHDALICNLLNRVECF